MPTSRIAQVDLSETQLARADFDEQLVIACELAPDVATLDIQQTVVAIEAHANLAAIEDWLPTQIAQVELSEIRLASADFEQLQPQQILAIDLDLAQCLAVVDIQQTIVAIELGSNVATFDDWPDMTRMPLTYNGEVVTVDGEPIWIVVQG